jgi:hypothetical protein
MPRRRPAWSIDFDLTSCLYAFFLSHVAEDAADVARLKAEIAAASGRGGRPALQSFLDLHDWQERNESGAVI